MPTIKRSIIQQLEQYDWYFRLRYSKPFLRYIEFKYKDLNTALVNEYQVYQQVFQAFQRPFLVFDIGANQGYSAAIFLELGAEVICVEPDARNYKALKARFHQHPKVHIVSQAVSNQVGEATFYQIQAGSALNTLNEKWKTTLENPQNNRWKKAYNFEQQSTVATTTLDELIRQFGRPDFIKIDVEGFEQQVIEGLSGAVPMLCFEANLPEFQAETVACLAHLSQLSKQAVFNYSIGQDLVLEQGLSYKAFKKFISETDIRYLEVFCWS